MDALRHQLLQSMCTQATPMCMHAKDTWSQALKHAQTLRMLTLCKVSGLRFALPRCSLPARRQNARLAGRRQNSLEAGPQLPPPLSRVCMCYIFAFETGVIACRLLELHATLLCYLALLPCSATVLCYRALLPCSATVLCYLALLPCSAARPRIARASIACGFISCGCCLNPKP